MLDCSNLKSLYRQTAIAMLSPVFAGSKVAIERRYQCFSIVTTLSLKRWIHPMFHCLDHLMFVDKVVVAAAVVDIAAAVVVVAVDIVAG